MKHKKLYVISFSILILVGLCIGVFADNVNPGDYFYFKPYNCGQLYSTMSTTHVTLEQGYYYLHLFRHATPDSDIVILNVGDTGITFSDSSVVVTSYDLTTTSNTVTIPLGDYNEVYISFYLNVDYYDCYLPASNFDDGDPYFYVDFYYVKDTSIDPYLNSQDVWTSIVSTVTTGTNTILDSDILLLFAAALPIISFGAGMLIRLFRRS